MTIPTLSMHQKYPPTSLSVERVRPRRIIQSNFQSTFNNQQSTNPQPPGLQAAGLQCFRLLAYAGLQTAGLQPQQASSTSLL